MLLSGGLIVDELVLIVGTGSDEKIQRIAHVMHQVIKATNVTMIEAAEAFHRVSELSRVETAINELKVGIDDFTKLVERVNPQSWIPQFGIHCDHWPFSWEWFHKKKAFNPFTGKRLFYRKQFMCLKTFNNLRFL